MKNAIYTYLRKCPPSLELFEQLERVGNLYLIGGVLREFRDYHKIHSLRDIDIIVEINDRQLWEKTLRDFAFRTNRFGGNKLICHDLLVDAWALEETWAFRNHIVECEPKDYVTFLPSTVFLNIDSIIYDWNNEIWYDEIYQEAMQTRILDVVLEKNPQLLLNIVRAFVLKNRYQMQFSSKLKEIIFKQYENARNFSLFCDELFAEQVRRYNKPVLSKADLLNELNALKLKL